MHPILQSLISTPLEWMYRVLCVFNEGDLQKYEHIVEVYKEQLKSQVRNVAWNCSFITVYD